MPTKRSASECVDDLSQIMTDLNLNIDELSKANRTRYCPYHSCFIEEDDDEVSVPLTKANPPDSCDDENDESDNDEDTDKGSVSSHNSNGERKLIDNKILNLKICDCQKKYRDEEKPMKSVRFDERVYELRIASRLYDRRAFTKYRLSSRHHPLSNQNNHHNSGNNNGGGKSKCKNKKKRNNKSQSNNNPNSTNGSDNQGVKKQTKSQRAKQSKKAKKKLNSMKREDHSSTDTSSDDQGYCSSLHSLSD